MLLYSAKQNLSAVDQRRRDQTNNGHHPQHQQPPFSSCASTSDLSSALDCRPPTAGLIQASAVAAAAAMFSAATVSGHKMSSLPVLPPSSLSGGNTVTSEQLQQFLHLQQMLMQSTMSSSHTSVASTQAPVSSASNASLISQQVGIYW